MLSLLKVYTCIFFNFTANILDLCHFCISLLNIPHKIQKGTWFISGVENRAILEKKKREDTKL